MTYIQIKNLKKQFDEGQITALDGVNLEIEKGEFVAIMGPSGCGKSTLMNMISALDTPSEGEIIIGGKKLSDFKDLSEFRAKKLGFIFQLHNLIPTLSAVENVQIPMFENKVGSQHRYEKAKKLLDLVGLENRVDNLPTKLSGGERQRVAAARALANDPEILIADEPTGALDSKKAKDLLGLLKEIHQEKGITIIMVTHDREVASCADRIINMKDGSVII